MKRIFTPCAVPCPLSPIWSRFWRLSLHGKPPLLPNLLNQLRRSHMLLHLRQNLNLKVRRRLQLAGFLSNSKGRACQAEQGHLTEELLAGRRREVAGQELLEQEQQGQELLREQEQLGQELIHEQELPGQELRARELPEQEQKGHALPAGRLATLCLPVSLLPLAFHR